MKWFNVGLLAMGLGMLLTSPPFLPFPSRIFRPDMHEAGLDQISILAIEVLSDDIILLQIRVEPAQATSMLSTYTLEKIQTAMLERQQQTDGMN